ncbi:MULTISPECIES: diaminopimelate epimerase [unclassified Prevotella]|uniref:diaminopimelate epimerase n=1 Tax=unclassified Prevotella TaxID=2638335 RepID=UPI000B96DD58|nr:MULTISPECIES: diaminopimelate epimerase [unclassified Prevotella]OYP62786.1 diaminopimelate epimerase [Prevotella sp. P5-108]OYP66859.1 diaminopimelate epimerase [Prevotella sp. P5-64]OYP68574.1 diaminopimelate epimerase [Prevotella sp. P4-67]
MHNRIHFTKMDGAGNDYIYVDTTRYPISDPQTASVKWSNRHTGIGSDGLVLIGKPSILSGADFSMRIFNADGSEAKMCGNASRCIGKYLYERHLTDSSEIKLETLSGVKTLSLTLSPDRLTVTGVTVDMLQPAFHQASQYDEQVGLDALREYGHPLFVSMGNPHCVVFVDDIAAIDVARVGAMGEHLPAFPERCNIEFAQLTGTDELRTRVWERGSGITMACGTGACATAVAAAHVGLTSRESDVVMDGGRLHVRWAEDDHVMLSGPAEFVYDGEITL